MSGLIADDWVVAKRCGQNAARHYLRSLGAAGISYRVVARERKFQIEVPEKDLNRCSELLQVLPIESSPSQDNSSNRLRVMVGCWAGILGGVIAGAILAELWLPRLVSILPPVLAIIGGLCGAAARR